MKLIPVLDLKFGQVVHARHGDRSAYRPVKTHLCRGSRPLDLCRGLLGLHPFTTIYVADLDSITGGGSNEAAVAELRAAFPRVEFWVDGGLPAAAAEDWLRRHERGLVLGSESQTGVEEVAALVAGERDGAGGKAKDNARAGGKAKAKAEGKERVILSLDFRGGAFLGPRELLSRTEIWPRRVIVMTLARVGAGEGPDYGCLARIISRAKDHEVMAAGGVRDGDDLDRLRGMGVAGVLLASALFDGRMGGEEIARFYGAAPAP